METLEGIASQEDKELLLPFSTDEIFDEGRIIEIRFRRAGYHRTQEDGCDTRVGYVIKKSTRHDKNLLLSLTLPKNRIRIGHKINRDDISSYREFVRTEQEFIDLKTIQLPSEFKQGTIVEIIGSSDEAKKMIGYIHDISSEKIYLSMDHPSNRFSFSRWNTRQVNTYDLLKYRVLGQRDIW